MATILDSDALIFFVNVRKVEDKNVDPDFTLLRYLREKLELPGTKLGCGEGGCGACTVMISRYHPKEGKIEHYTVNACLAPIASVHGLAVTTVEGIGSTKTSLHPVQERIAKAHGSQCGFCTPGFVMSMYTLLRKNPQPSMQEIEENLVGNLCRCTGYRPILEGFKTFTKEAQNGCGKKNCCQLQSTDTNGHLNGNGHMNGKGHLNSNGYLSGNGHLNENGQSAGTVCETSKYEPTAVLFQPESFQPHDPSQEIIFPPELKLHYSHLANSSAVFRGTRTTYFRPSTLKELLRMKSIYPHAKLVVGNTEVGVEVKFKNQEYPVIISPVNVPELLQIIKSGTGIEVGAAVPLSTVEAEFTNLIKNVPTHKSQVFQSILEMLKYFAGRQIRNVAAIGGNIMTGSPISDLNPIFMASGTKLKFQSEGGLRVIEMDDKFYTSYRKNTALPEEVLVSILIPFLNENEYFKAYKQARRRDDDIAIVNAAMKVRLREGSLVVDSLTMVVGGMGPTTLMARQTMEFVQGREWDESLVENTMSTLFEELTLDPSAPGGMVNYRLALSASFFFKFYQQVRQELLVRTPSLLLMKDEVRNKIIPHQYIPHKSTQIFQNVPQGQAPIDPIGRPIPHSSCLQQTTGEATYIDDIPKYKNELHASLITSTHSHAKIINIDPSKALSEEGVIAFFCAKDLTDLQNQTGPVVKDEEVFASSEVKCVGQIIGVLVARDQTTAQRAGKKVHVQYEDLSNPIITIQDAIKENSFWEPVTLETGDVEEGFKSSDHIFEGESYIGGQEHFYLETNSHIAVPHEDGEMEIFSSAQNPSQTHSQVANALGISENRVTIRVKRLGGAFGGKETRSVTVCLPIAVAAQKLGRPVRIMLDRDEDMLITGTRHPVFAKYKVGCTNDGVLEAVELDIYANAGWSLDVSASVSIKTLLVCDNAYRFKNFKATARNCKTNIPSCTAFRGFGGIQGVFIIEDLLTEVAERLQMDQNMVRQRNFYELNGNFTPYGQVLNDCYIRKCWNEVLENSDYNQRRNGIEEFNRKHRYRKRGISVMPAKYTISYEVSFLNQSGALVNIYLDGSVLVTYAGTEMGQGLNTKMIQVASRALGVPIEKIYISESSTDKVPNTIYTSASCGSDLNGMAVLNACEKLNSHLQPFKKKLPNGQWVDWVRAAFFERVSLSATGFYRTPGITEYCFKTRTGSPFNYFCYGAGVTEVEIDCLTGDHTVLRTDIVMDVGNSLNPAIDIGQIEGAFAQGMGLFTMEELVYSPTGVLLTRGPGSYKIPSIQDIPKEFNVSLLRGSQNPRAIYSSKAVGEPPLLLSTSVFFAIRDAIRSARSDAGLKGYFQLLSPATAERIRKACEDSITMKIKPANLEAFTPWSVRI